MVDSTKEHVRITIAKSMEGVEPGTGVPGLDEIKPVLEANGFWLRGFEVVEPGKHEGPTQMKEMVGLLRAVQRAAGEAIDDITCYGDPDPADELAEEFIEDLIVGAYSRVDDAWDKLDRYYEQAL